MNPMSSIIFLLPFVLFLTFQPHLVVARGQQSNATATATATASSLITQVCKGLTHKDFCVSVLEASPDSQKADLKGLLFIALKLAAKNATDTSTHIKQYLNDNSEEEPAEEQGLNDCSESYIDAVDQIDDAVVALSVNAYPDIDKWVKAAITDVDACEGLVQGQTTGQALEVSHNNHTLRLLLNVALGILHALSHN
uniref:Putative invertase/pectin methylesterase inhibitor family protein n=1 Tax=Davidia involucrata TaxID=16924 RepID=A0A5B7AQW7_DAVIN